MSVDSTSVAPNMLKRLIESLPKAELHLHVEGSFEPELMFTLAARNNLLDSLPFKDLAAAKLAYKFKDLQSFLDLYYSGCNVLLKEQDFYDLTWDYLERAAKEEVVYVEIMFDPQTHTERGIPFKDVIHGITRALTDAKAKLGIQSNIMMNFLRHLGPKASMATLKEAEPFREHITAVGLDSTELGWPPSMWEEVYKEAAKQGYRLSAHAGEEGPAEFVWQAIRSLRVERIDHGVHSIEDPELLKHLRDHRIPLTVCPLSNLKLKVYDGVLVERLKDLFSHGLLITINADDPSYFGGLENANLQWLVDEMGVSARELHTFVSNGFRAAFISDKEKDEYLAGVDAAFEKVMGQAALQALKAPEA